MIICIKIFKSEKWKIKFDQFLNLNFISNYFIIVWRQVKRAGSPLFHHRKRVYKALPNFRKVFKKVRRKEMPSLLLSKTLRMRQNSIIQWRWPKVEIILRVASNQMLT